MWVFSLEQKKWQRIYLIMTEPLDCLFRLIALKVNWLRQNKLKKYSYLLQCQLDVTELTVDVIQKLR
jgi:hypothetical protein